MTVQVSSLAKSVSGSSVKLVGPPLDGAVCAPLVAQEIVNQGPVTFTGSLKPIVMSESSATPIAPFAGPVVETDRRSEVDTGACGWTRPGVDGPEPASPRCSGRCPCRRGSD